MQLATNEDLFVYEQLACGKKLALNEKIVAND